MNLHGIVSPIIAAVNPMIPATLLVSTGFDSLPGGKREPTYAAPVTVRAQVQSLSYRDLTMIDGLNLNGVRRAIYLYGKVQGVNRAEGVGGDLVIIASGVSAGTWLVAMASEQWPDWCKVICTLQNP